MPLPLVEMFVMTGLNWPVKNLINPVSLQSLKLESQTRPDFCHLVRKVVF